MRKSKIIILLITILFAFVGSFMIGKYYENHKFDNVRSMNDLGISIPETKVKALRKGDAEAYHDLKITYLDYATEDFLPIALEMANTQNFPPAYYDVYSTMISMESLDEESDSISKWENWNPRMQRFALEYLLIGAKLKDASSIETIKDYYLENKKLSKILNGHKDLVSEYSMTLKTIEEAK
jgi:hypothetical protein